MDDLSRCRFSIFHRGFADPVFTFLQIVAVSASRAKCSPSQERIFVQTRGSSFFDIVDRRSMNRTRRAVAAARLKYQNNFCHSRPSEARGREPRWISSTTSTCWRAGETVRYTGVNRTVRGKCASSKRKIRVGMISTRSSSDRASVVDHLGPLPEHELRSCSPGMTKILW